MSTDTPDTSRVVEATPEYESGFSGISPVKVDKKGRFSIVKSITWNGENISFENYSIFWNSRTGLFYIIPHELLKSKYNPAMLAKLQLFKVGDPTKDGMGRIGIPTKRNELFKMPPGTKFLGGMGAYMILASDQRSITEVQHNQLDNATIENLLHPEIAQQVIRGRQTTDSPGQNQQIGQDVADTQSLIASLIQLRLSQGESADNTVDIEINMPCGKDKILNLKVNIVPPKTAFDKPAGAQEVADSERTISSIAKLINGFVNTVLHQVHPQNASTQINFGHYNTRVSVALRRRERKLQTKASPAQTPNIRF